MKAIVCELCGSNEFVKEDKYFVCQYCGTKYSAEDAKKLLVEGTVKIDESNKLSNMLKNAEDLYYDGKTEEAYKLFGEVLNIDTKCSTAILYRGLCYAWRTTIKNPKPISDCVNQLEKALKNEEEKNTDKKKYVELCQIGLKEINRIYTVIAGFYLDYCTKYMDFANKKAEEVSQYIADFGTYGDLNYQRKKLNDAGNMLKDAKETYYLMTEALKTWYRAAIQITLFNNKDKNIFDESFIDNVREEFISFLQAIYNKIPEKELEVIIKLDYMIIDILVKSKEKDILIKRIELFINKEKWGRAELYCDKALELEKNNAYYWLLKIMINEKWKITDEGVFFTNADTDGIKKIEDCRYYNDLEKYSKKNKQILDKIQLIKNERMEYYYVKAKKIISSNGTIKDYEIAIQYLENIEQYKDADDLIVICKKRIADQKANSSKVEELLEAKNIYENNKEWEESKKSIEKIDEKIKKIDIDKKHRKKVIKTIIITASVIFVLLIIIIANIIGKTIEKDKKYEEAVGLFNQKNYEEAIDIFSTLKNYRDSKYYIERSNNYLKFAKGNYEKAIEQLETGSTDTAYSLFLKAGKYLDSEEKAKEALVQKDIENFGKNHRDFFSRDLAEYDYEVIKNDEQLKELIVGNWYEKGRGNIPNHYTYLSLYEDGTGETKDKNATKSNWTVSGGYLSFGTRKYWVIRLMDGVYLLCDVPSEAPAVLLVSEESQCKIRLENKHIINDSEN